MQSPLSNTSILSYDLDVNATGSDLLMELEQLQLEETRIDNELEKTTHERTQLRRALDVLLYSTNTIIHEERNKKNNDEVQIGKNCDDDDKNDNDTNLDIISRNDSTLDQSITQLYNSIISNTSASREICFHIKALDRALTRIDSSVLHTRSSLLLQNILPTVITALQKNDHQTLTSLLSRTLIENAQFIYSQFFATNTLGKENMIPLPCTSTLDVLLLLRYQSILSIIKACTRSITSTPKMPSMSSMSSMSTISSLGFDINNPSNATLTSSSSSSSSFSIPDALVFSTFLPSLQEKSIGLDLYASIIAEKYLRDFVLQNPVVIPWLLEDNRSTVQYFHMAYPSTRKRPWSVFYSQSFIHFLQQQLQLQTSTQTQAQAHAQTHAQTHAYVQGEQGTTPTSTSTPPTIPTRLTSQVFLEILQLLYEKAVYTIDIHRTAVLSIYGSGSLHRLIQAILYIVSIVARVLQWKYITFERLYIYKSLYQNTSVTLVALYNSILDHMAIEAISNKIIDEKEIVPRIDILALSSSSSSSSDVVDIAISGSDKSSHEYNTNTTTTTISTKKTYKNTKTQLSPEKLMEFQLYRQKINARQAMVNILIETRKRYQFSSMTSAQYEQSISKVSILPHSHIEYQSYEQFEDFSLEEMRKLGIRSHGSQVSHSTQTTKTNLRDEEIPTKILLGVEREVAIDALFSKFRQKNILFTYLDQYLLLLQNTSKVKVDIMIPKFSVGGGSVGGGGQTPSLSPSIHPVQASLISSSSTSFTSSSSTTPTTTSTSSNFLGSDTPPNLSYSIFHRRECEVWTVSEASFYLEMNQIDKLSTILSSISQKSHQFIEAVQTVQRQARNQLEESHVMYMKEFTFVRDKLIEKSLRIYQEQEQVEGRGEDQEMDQMDQVDHREHATTATTHGVVDKINSRNTTTTTTTTTTTSLSVPVVSLPRDIINQCNHIASTLIPISLYQSIMNDSLYFHTLFSGSVGTSDSSIDSSTLISSASSIAKHDGNVHNLDNSDNLDNLDDLELELDLEDTMSIRKTYSNILYSAGIQLSSLFPLLHCQDLDIDTILSGDEGSSGGSGGGGGGGSGNENTTAIIPITPVIPVKATPFHYPNTLYNTYRYMTQSLDVCLDYYVAIETTYLRLHSLRVCLLDEFHGDSLYSISLAPSLSQIQGLSTLRPTSSALYASQQIINGAIGSNSLHSSQVSNSTVESIKQQYVKSISIDGGDGIESGSHQSYQSQQSQQSSYQPQRRSQSQSQSQSRSHLLLSRSHITFQQESSTTTSLSDDLLQIMDHVMTRSLETQSITTIAAILQGISDILRNEIRYYLVSNLYYYIQYIYNRQGMLKEMASFSTTPGVSKPRTSASTSSTTTTATNANANVATATKSTSSDTTSTHITYPTPEFYTITTPLDDITLEQRDYRNEYTILDISQTPLLDLQASYQKIDEMSTKYDIISTIYSSSLQTMTQISNANHYQRVYKQIYSPSGNGVILSTAAQTQVQSELQSTSSQATTQDQSQRQGQGQGQGQGQTQGFSNTGKTSDEIQVYYQRLLYTPKIGMHMFKVDKSRSLSSSASSSASSTSTSSTSYSSSMLDQDDFMPNPKLLSLILQLSLQFAPGRNQDIEAEALLYTIINNMDILKQNTMQLLREVLDDVQELARRSMIGNVTDGDGGDGVTDADGNSRDKNNVVNTPLPIQQQQQQQLLWNTILSIEEIFTEKDTGFQSLILKSLFLITNTLRKPLSSGFSRFKYTRYTLLPDEYLTCENDNDGMTSYLYPQYLHSLKQRQLQGIEDDNDGGNIELELILRQQQWNQWKQWQLQQFQSQQLQVQSQYLQYQHPTSQQQQQQPQFQVPPSIIHTTVNTFLQENSSTLGKYPYISYIKWTHILITILTQLLQQYSICFTKNNITIISSALLHYTIKYLEKAFLDSPSPAASAASIGGGGGNLKSGSTSVTPTTVNTPVTTTTTTATSTPTTTTTTTTTTPVNMNESTLWGGLAFDRDLREFIQFWTDVTIAGSITTGTTTRDKFSKLLQITTILQISSVSELSEFLKNIIQQEQEKEERRRKGGRGISTTATATATPGSSNTTDENVSDDTSVDWKLTLHEIAKLIQLRVDLDPIQTKTFMTSIGMM